MGPTWPVFRTEDWFQCWNAGRQIHGKQRRKADHVAIESVHWLQLRHKGVTGDFRLSRFIRGEQEPAHGGGKGRERANIEYRQFLPSKVNGVLEPEFKSLSSQIVTKAYWQFNEPQILSFKNNENISAHLGIAG